MELRGAGRISFLRNHTASLYCFPFISILIVTAIPGIDPDAAPAKKEKSGFIPAE
jgi:hypothetical protein